jgi:hypothetical protein
VRSCSRMITTVRDTGSSRRGSTLRRLVAGRSSGAFEILSQCAIGESSCHAFFVCSILELRGAGSLSFLGDGSERRVPDKPPRCSEHQNLLNASSALCAPTSPEVRRSRWNGRVTCLSVDAESGLKLLFFEAVYGFKHRREARFPLAEVPRGATADV